MIKGILFDYGGVVADGGRGIELAKRLCTMLGLPDINIDSLIFPLFGQLTRGKIDVEAFWSKIEAEAGIHISDVQRHAWDKWWGYQPYPEMLQLIDVLQSAGYTVGLLSNIIPPTKDRILAAGGYESFDFIVLSCDVGYAKPDPEIYDLAIAKFNNLKPEELVFVDDQEKCLPPAEALGMKTILATDSQQIITDLQMLGLPV